MDARISPWIPLIALVFTAPLTAMPASDCVAVGRAKLFDGTASGPARACDAFAAGLTDIDPEQTAENRELLFLHALARTTILLGEYDESFTLEALLRWVERFAPALATGKMNAPGVASTGPAQANWSRLPATLAKVELGGILAELGSIDDEPAPFIMHLKPAETGLRNDLEIDFGDVLMLKSTLLALGACFLEPERTGSKPVGREQAHAAVGSWIAEMPSLLGFSHNAAWAGQKDGAWAEAVSCYRDAVSYIASENCPTGADPQTDELVYIDPRHLAAVRVELEDAAEAAANDGLVAYDVFDANSVQIGELTLAFSCPAGGQAGRLNLADGTSLEIDWFGSLDAGEIGISMASAGGAIQGWFHGAIASDRSTITDASLELWGRTAEVVEGLAARAKIEASTAPDELLAQGDRSDKWGI